MYLERPFQSEKSTIAAHDSTFDVQNKTQNRDQNILRNLFTDRILEIMTEAKENMLDRRRSIKVETHDQKMMLKQAIEMTLQELGPSFGLKPCIIPQIIDSEPSFFGSNQYLPLSGELKTEIMHNAAFILREQAQGSDEVGIHKLENVVDLNSGAMRQILKAGKYPNKRKRLCQSLDTHTEQDEEEMVTENSRRASCHGVG